MKGSGSPWVNLQISFGLAGGAVWFAGALFERDFVSGIGVGLVSAALLLRLGRRAADDGPARRESGSGARENPVAGED